MQIPDVMRTIEIREQRLTLTERPVPKLGPGQVLIKVDAAGVNRPDVMQRKGMYPPPPGASDIPGLEVAGVVVAVGTEANWAVGDKLCALVTGGGYAEYCLASSRLCLPIPDNLSFVEAAGIPETYFTVWSNVFDRGGLKRGETMLVHGGSSGIGTTAIQFGKAFNATVLVTCGSKAKCDFCKDLGADAAINYQDQDFVEEIRNLTKGKGVDLILDMIGGDYLPRNLKSLADEGRLVQIAVQKNPKAEVNLLQVMLKRLTLTGSTLRARDDDFKAEIASKLHKHIWPLIISKTIKPIIHSTFPIERAMEAHQLMESNQHMGKIILKVTQ